MNGGTARPGPGTLRAVVAADLPALAALHAGCFPAEPWDAAQLAALLATPGCQGLQLVRGEAATGFLLWRQVADEAEILTLAVAAAWRRRGLGATLLEALLARLLAAGARRLFLEVAADNAAALALYRGAGFRPVGRRPAYYRDGGDALVLRLELPGLPGGPEDTAE